MKFICTRDNFIQSLRSVSHIAGKNTSLPILNNILIKAVGGGVQCVTTNLEIGITSSMRAKVEEEGVLTIPAKILLEYVQLTNAETLTCATAGTDLVIQLDKHHTTIRGIPADDFPLLPEVTAEKALVATAGALKDGLANVVFAAAQDETRVEISGIFLTIVGGTCVVAATDSYRLAEQTIPLAKPFNEELAVIIPNRTVYEMIRVVGDVPRDAEVTLQINQHQLFLKIEGVTLLSRLIEGRYPDYRAIIPTTAETRFVAERAALVQEVKRASLFARPGINDLTLAFDASEKQLEFRAGNSQLGEHQATLKGEFRGSDQTIVVNYRYLLDGLNAFSSDTVAFEVNNNTSPVVIRAHGDGKSAGYVYLVMPIKQ